MSTAKLPFIQIAASVVLSGVILWFGRPFLVPLAYAFLIALVLFPFCRYLESRGWKRSLAIALPLFMVSLVFGGLVALLGYEAAIITGNWPLLEQQFTPFLARVQAFVERDFGWTTEEQSLWIRETLSRFGQNAGTFLRDSLHAMIEGFMNLIIIPIYVALLLTFRGRLVRFLIAVTPAHLRDRMHSILDETVIMFSRFIRGMVVVYLTVGVLNTIGLWAIGVEDPLVYGMLTAVMTIIPYFGIMISALLPITISWLTTGSVWQPLGIIAVFSFVQYLEANLIFPYVVGRYVNLNTLAAIIAIFLGALFWGVSGMILFLPFFAVMHIFTRHFPEMKHWSEILGK